MEYILHRVNTAEELKRAPTRYGVELDLRDRGNRLILQHDPFSDGEDFEEYLRHYRHGTLIANVKSERIEERVLSCLKQAAIEDYFFLDCSFPMLRELVNLGEHQIAARFSEFEPIEGPMSLAGQVEWIWLDCFTKMPLTPDSYQQLKPHFKLCLVSPELQGHDLSSIPKYAKAIAGFDLDAICTKRPDLWNKARKVHGSG